MKVQAPPCPHPKCRSRMVRLYAREKKGGRYRFVPVGWWCRECGIIRAPPKPLEGTISDGWMIQRVKND